MDPQATFNDLLDAVGARDRDLIEELADSLLRWMEHGGFPPLTVGPKSLGRRWHRAIAAFVCHAAQSKVRNARNQRRK